jgi:peptide/nickel transport system permease protein
VGTYIVRRLVVMVLMLVLLSIAVFLLFSAIPADPARLTCGKACTPQVVAANRHRLGLDQPLWKQYDQFVSGIFFGRTYGEGRATFTCHVPCLGYSFRKGEQVTDLLEPAIPVTASLAIGGFVLWMVGGIASGMFAALHRGKWQDRTVMGFALVGYSFPSFFIALLLIFFVQIRWGLIGFYSYVPLHENPEQWFKSLFLPWIALALLEAAYYSRLTRNQMLETLGEDYVRTARAKGLPERSVIVRHAFRAGLNPIVTSAGLDLGALLGGAIIIEAVFNLPGLGRLSVDSVLDADLPVITATTLVAAGFVIVANLVVDLLYVWIDPRVRLWGPAD